VLCGGNGEYLKKGLDILTSYVILFSVMRNGMKDDHIDWLNTQSNTSAPVEGHEGYRVESREMQEHDLTSEVDEDCGWFGYEGLCED